MQLLVCVGEMVAGRSAEFPAGDSWNPDVKATNSSFVSTVVGLMVAWLRGVHWILEASDTSVVADIALFTDWVGLFDVQVVRI